MLPLGREERARHPQARAQQVRAVRPGELKEVLAALVGEHRAHLVEAADVMAGGLEGGLEDG
jgi:hypothetical protein